MRRDQTFAAEGSWPAVLHGLGLSEADILRAADLPGDTFRRERARLTTSEFFALWLAVETAVGNQAFPLLLADQITGDVFAPCQFSALCSPNMAVGLERLATYKRLTAPMSLQIEKGREHTQVSVRWLVADAPPPASLVAFELAYLVRVIRIGTRCAIAAVELVSQLAMRPTEVVADWMGVAPRTGDRNAVSFRNQDLERPFLTSNIGIWRTFEKGLRVQLAELQRSSSTVERVRAVLLQALPSGRGTLDETSRALGLTPRTLQRRLKDERTVFKTVLQATRQRLAAHYLAQTDISATEIGFLLGFDDASSFFRAFQSWTGSTPDATRRALRADKHVKAGLGVP